MLKLEVYLDISTGELSSSSRINRVYSCVGIYEFDINVMIFHLFCVPHCRSKYSLKKTYLLHVHSLVAFSSEYQLREFNAFPYSIHSLLHISPFWVVICDMSGLFHCLLGWWLHSSLVHCRWSLMPPSLVASGITFLWCLGVHLCIPT